MEIKPKGKPYPYQLEAIAFHTSRPSSLNLFSPGLGKSLIALHSLEGLSKVLIVCPAYLKFNWEQEVDKWVEGGEFTIVSYEGLKKVPPFGWDALICDEVHYCKNKDANRTKRVFNVVNHGVKKFIGLTGTPVSKNVIDFWSLLKITLQEKFKYSYWQYCNTFSHSRQISFQGRTINKFYGLKNREKLIPLIRSCAIRKKTSDVLDLPDQVYKEILIKDKFDKKLKDAYQEYLKTEDLDGAISSFKLVNAVEKVPYTIKLVEDFVEQGVPVVVYTDHVKSCELIAAHFKVPAIHGQSNVNRGEVITDFNEGRQDVIVATITSMNTGVNLVRARHMVFNDFNFTYAENEQAEKRIHRIGQTQTCFYYYVFASQMDQQIKKITDEKKEIATKVLSE